MNGSTKRYCERGAALIEGAIIIPILILLLVGMIDLGMILHARYTTQAALEEGVRMAHQTGSLRNNIWGLPANDPKAVAYKKGRETLAGNVLKIIDLTSLHGVKLKGVKHHDVYAAGATEDAAELPIAYLPPAYTAYVPALEREIANSSFCKASSGGVISGTNSATHPAFDCDRSQPVAVVSKVKPTEIVAFVEVPTMLFGRYQTSVKAAAFFGDAEGGDGPEAPSTTTNVDNTTNVTNVDNSSSNSSTSTTVNNANVLKNGLKVFNKPGTYSFTVPADVSRILVEVWGAGAGGGFDTSGGGAGGYAKGYLEVAAGESYTVVVGKGGASAGAMYGGVWGGVGGLSQFGDIMKATGGQPGTWRDHDWMARVYTPALGGCGEILPAGKAAFITTQCGETKKPECTIRYDTDTQHETGAAFCQHGIAGTVEFEQSGTDRNGGNAFAGGQGGRWPGWFAGRFNVKDGVDGASPGGGGSSSPENTDAHMHSKVGKGGNGGDGAVVIAW